MTTIYNKIHRLKQQSGWTWEVFFREIDKLPYGSLDEKTIYNLYRSPERRPNKHVSDVINQLHEQYFPDPFPEEINRLMRLYNQLEEREILDLEFFLLAQLPREPAQDFLRIARINWLLGNIQFDRIPALRDSHKRRELAHCKQQAIEYYTASVMAIEQHNQTHPSQAITAHQLYKARHNILACYLNAVPKEQRNTDSELLNYLKQSNYIPNSKQTILAEPFQWSIARNGLRFSSLIEQASDVDYFFRALIHASPKFIDLNYAPLDFNPIAMGSDFAWAIKHVLTTDYLNKLTHL